MLQLKKITKTYQTGEFKQEALQDVSIDFRENEFVSILGPSGSGKTTLLNIIGGLDQYTSGDLFIRQRSTKNFKDRDWDTYRNHSIGFVFQSYNLIAHQSAIVNVEMALRLSGVSKQERIKRAEEMLKAVGLYEHRFKKPSQMSGGQQQRICIARALINDPEILLADEPTGALDSQTSQTIMNLLTEIAKDRLVIMVTHNTELAMQYSSRIIKLLDGKVTEDSNPFTITDSKEISTKQKRTNMGFLTALSLSFSNLLTKKTRTFLSAFAGSIGIIGIALILSLSSGVEDYIQGVEEDTMSAYPITIEQTDINFAGMLGMQLGAVSEKEEIGKKQSIESDNQLSEMLATQVKQNNLVAFKEAIEKSKEIKEATLFIQYSYDVTPHIYMQQEDEIYPVNPTDVFEEVGMFGAPSSNLWKELVDDQKIVEERYELITGKLPQNKNEVVLITNSKQKVSDMALFSLGILARKELSKLVEDVDQGKEIEISSKKFSYEDIIGLEYNLMLPTQLYEKREGIWVDLSSDQDFVKEQLEKSQKVSIVGILKRKEEQGALAEDRSVIGYLPELSSYITEEAKKSEILKEQMDNPDINVFTGSKFGEVPPSFSERQRTQEEQFQMNQMTPEMLARLVNSYNENINTTYEQNLAKLGYKDLSMPDQISLFPKDFDSKAVISDFIVEYNQKKIEKNQKADVIEYTDFVGLILSSVTSMVDMISYVLIAFISISLIVSSIMIGIITYISVLERTKEIGILRAIGASKRDIARVFNAETIIEGLLSGMLGIGITYVLIFPINQLIENISGASNLAKLPPIGALVLIAISVLLTLIAGLIPSRIAAKKDPVEALRTE